MVVTIHQEDLGTMEEPSSRGIKEGSAIKEKHTPLLFPLWKKRHHVSYGLRCDYGKNDYSLTLKHFYDELKTLIVMMN